MDIWHLCIHPFQYNKTIWPKKQDSPILKPSCYKEWLFTNVTYVGGLLQSVINNHPESFSNLFKKGFKLISIETKKKSSKITE